MVMVLSFAIPELVRWLSGGPPVEDGTVLIYQVDEETGNENKRYGVKVRFQERKEGVLRADIMTGHGVRSFNVTKTLEPTGELENDPLEFPTESGRAVEPGLLWLPEDRRVPGMNTVAGMVDGVVGRGRFQAWEVKQETGSVFYDQETGILVAFELETGRTKVKGTLQGIY